MVDGSPSNETGERMSSQLLNAAARLEGLEASMPVKGPWRLQSNAVYYQYPSGTMGVLVNRGSCNTELLEYVATADPVFIKAVAGLLRAIEQGHFCRYDELPIVQAALAVAHALLPPESSDV